MSACESHRLWLSEWVCVLCSSPQPVIFSCVIALGISVTINSINPVRVWRGIPSEPSWGFGAKSVCAPWVSVSSRRLAAKGKDCEHTFTDARQSIGYTVDAFETRVCFLSESSRTDCIWCSTLSSSLKWSPGDRSLSVLFSQTGLTNRESQQPPNPIATPNGQRSTSVFYIMRAFWKAPAAVCETIASLWSIIFFQLFVIG